ncbi:hypothetical protein SDC9_123610 [bioreactor metagenome]|uniref:Uncharacterized protein n=1 Tax=bioreactor metagenome TaxID=1076179 RepID=A0A645CI43_9ZZZZ
MGLHPVVQHRPEQDLVGEGGEPTISCEKRDSCGEPCSRADAHHDDPVGVDAEFLSIPGEPDEACIAVVDGCGMGVLGGEPVLDGHHNGRSIGRMRHEDVDSRVPVAHHHAAAVHVVDRGQGQRPGRRPKNCQMHVRGAVGSRDVELVHRHGTTGGEVEGALGVRIALTLPRERLRGHPRLGCREVPERGDEVGVEGRPAGRRR